MTAQELVSTIHAFLASADHSATSGMADTARDYARLCQDTNAALMQCAELIGKGDFDAAEHLETSVKPPLSTVAASLELGEVRQAWLDICELYEWPLPPAVDTKSLAILNDAPFAKPGLEALARKWRGIARNGSLREKLRLIRQIVQTDGGDTPQWRANLTTLESAAVPVITREAEQALSSGNLSHLRTLHTEIFALELNNRIPHDTLASFETALHRHAIEETAKYMEEVLASLGEAYAAQDEADVARLLKLWETKSGSPLFTPSVEQLTQVQEAKAWLKGIHDEQARDNLFQDKLAGLREAMDTERPFGEVTALYQALKRLERPLPDGDEVAFNAYSSRCALSEHRRHVRICLFGTLSALSIAFLLLCGLRAYQRRTVLRETRAVLADALDAGNASGALRIFNDAAARHDCVTGDAPCEAITAEAQRRVNAFLDKLTALEKMTATFQGTDEARAEAPDVLTEADTMRNTLRETEAFARTQSSLADSGRATAVFTAANELLDAHSALVATAQKQRDELFDRECNALSVSLKDAQDSIQAKDQGMNLTQPDITAFQNVILDAENRFAKLKTARISKQHLRQWESIIDSQLHIARESTGIFLDNIDLMQTLDRPVGFDSFIFTLEQLPVKSTLLAEFYAAAISMAPVWKHIGEAAAALAASPLMLFSDSAASAVMVPDSPFAADLTMAGLAPGGEAAALASVNGIAHSLRENLLPSIDVYELIFRNEVGKTFYFYANAGKSPVLERKTTGELKSIMLNPLNCAIPGKVLFGVLLGKTPEGNTAFLPNVIPTNALKLPKTFTSLTNADIAGNNVTFSKSLHSRHLLNTLADIQSAELAAVEAALFTSLQTLADDSSMNPYMQRAIALSTMKMLLACRPLNALPIQDAINKLTAAIGRANWDAFKPTEATEHETEIDNINNAMKQLKALRTQCAFYKKLYLIALSRLLTPAAVVIRHNAGNSSLFRLRETPSHELWSVTTEDNTTTFRYFRTDNGELDVFIKAAPPGTVLFAPTSHAMPDTARLTDELTTEAASLNLPTITWPASWPTPLYKNRYPE